MNRALPLLIAAAVLGGGLAFLALKSGGAGSPQGGQPSTTLILDASASPKAAKAPASEQPDTSASLAAVDSDRASAAAASGGTARSWEIIPVNTVGQRIDTAVLTATPSAAIQSRAQPMKGTGRTRWTSLAAGAWTLTVEDASGPTWTREVLLEADDAKRTTVYIGDELRISGVIQDSNGATLPSKTPVFFLPKGVSHPTRAQMKAAGKSREPAGPTNGAVAIQTDRKGRFKTRLPNAGEYRLSVGAPDKARWTQSKGVELTHGGSDHVVVTVPALAELTVTFSGDSSQRATAMSAYVFDAERAARLSAQTAQRRAPGKANSVQQAQREAKEAILGKDGKGDRSRGGGAKKGNRGSLQGGTARSMQEENARLARQDFNELGYSGEVARTPLFEPGWRSIGSRQVNAEGKAVFNDLPDGEDVRFLFVRGPERIATQAPIRLRKQQRAIGTVTLPPPSTEPGFRQSNQASINVKDNKDSSRQALEPGAQWSVATR